jgi:eukaryotic-like serine/threonine-protein kinase
LNKLQNSLIDAIYSQALALDGEARGKFIADRCKGDPELKVRLMSLLHAAEASDDRLAQRFDDIRGRLWRCVLTGDSAAEDLSGQRIDAWRIETQIARGGLATVYLARRDDGAFEQTVAFKVLRRGLDTDDLVARFRAERQILSALDHPCIAQILDGGALEDGRPYLVMEYVDGLPITSYCSIQKVGIRGRIELLLDVLGALHHAHTHLVVHRDVKPSNILVSAEGNVVLLDFGIAKLLDPHALPGASTITRTGVSLLTPGYGSPEQFAGRAVTTASDIYQVGMVMYELLTGTRPVDGQREHAAADPPPPSRVLRAKPEYREVRGDLDAITRKAMHVDPRQRYASADQMVSDLKRYLDGLPVIARPDTLYYRLAKLTRRKPWLVPALAITALGIGAYVTTLTIYSKRLAHEEQLAAASQQFMIDVFRSPDPYAPADPERGRNITVIEALEIGQHRVRTELNDQPELKASLLASIAEVYGSLDQSWDAINLREEALIIERELYGDRSRQAMESLRLLGKHYTAVGALSRAEAAFDEQLAIAAALFPGNDPELGVAEIALAMHARFKGDMGQSRELFQKGIDKLRRAPSEYARELIDALIASVEEQGLESAEPTFATIEEARRVADSAFGPDSLQTALVRIRLASTKTTFGDHEGSEQHFREAIPVLESRLGEGHGSTLSALNNLGYLYIRSNNELKAEEVYKGLLERQIAKRGTMHRAVAETYQNLAGAITYQGRYDESIPLHRTAYEIFTAVLNEDNFITAFPLLSIAYGELQRGNIPASEEAAREALSRLEATVAGSYLEGVARCLVGLSLERQGRRAEGGMMIEHSHELIGTANIPDPYPSLCRLPGSQVFAD